MGDLKDNRFGRTFAKLRSNGRDQKALMPFLTAGYPDLDTTGAMLADSESRGVLICEVGFPFAQVLVYQAAEVPDNPGIGTGGIDGAGHW